MSEHDNDSISEFFKNALRRPKIRFREDDWKKMEAMLDQSPLGTPTKKRRRNGAILSVAAILLISGVVLFVSLKDQQVPSVETASEKSEKSEMSEKSEKNEMSEMSEKNEKSESNEMRERQEDKSQEVIRENSRQVATISAPDHQPPLLSFEAPGNVVSQRPDSDPLIVHQNIEGDREVEKRTEKGTEKELELIPSEPVDVDSVQNDIVAPADSLPPDTESSVQPRWSIMLALSPDFTSPGMHKFTSPGRAASVSVYYHINDAVSISAGIVATNSNYWDAGYNYKPVDENFWVKKANGEVPDKAMGSCVMLNIPLGLRYNFYRTEKSNVYASAQLSSYFMFNESYKYVFKDPNPGAMTEWHAQRSSYSLFGVTNLAVGFERAISGRMMIGISPYVNIPLTNMGSWSNMKLYSVGTAFTFRYKFQRRT